MQVRKQRRVHKASHKEQASWLVAKPKLANAPTTQPPSGAFETPWGQALSLISKYWRRDSAWPPSKATSEKDFTRGQFHLCLKLCMDSVPLSSKSQGPVSSRLIIVSSRVLEQTQTSTWNAQPKFYIAQVFLQNVSSAKPLQSPNASKALR